MEPQPIYPQENTQPENQEDLKKKKILIISIIFGVLLIVSFGVGLLFLWQRLATHSDNPKVNLSGGDIDPKTPKESKTPAEYCMALKSAYQKNSSSINRQVTYQDESRYLNLWKEMATTDNKVTEAYFNNHIRIASYGRFDLKGNFPPRNEDEQIFVIDYIFTVDWMNKVGKSSFTIKKAGTFLTNDEIKLSKKNKLQAVLLSVAPVEHILSCDDAVNKLLSSDKSLLVGNVGPISPLYDIDSTATFWRPQIGADNGESCLSNKYISASINLITGAISQKTGFTCIE